MDRRTASKWLGLMALTGWQTAPAQQAGPSRNVRMVVPFPAGGPTDVQARAIAEGLGPILGATVVVDNRPGAGGLIGAAEVSKAKPDGSTLLYAPDIVITQTPHSLKRMPFDPLQGLTPIARASEAPSVLLVNSELPIKSVDELVAYAKANPGKVSYASLGTGSGTHIYGEVLGKSQGVDLIHVPYKGTADAMADFITNRTQFMFQSPSVISQFPGKFRVLAIAGTSRSPLLPSVPTLQELGYAGFEMSIWVGVFGPAGMPQPLVNELNAAINQALQRPQIAPMWRTQSFALLIEPPTGIPAMLRRDYERWGARFKQAGIEPQ